MEVLINPIPERGPALIYIHDDGPPSTVIRVDFADENVFQWMDARGLAFLDVLLTEVQRRLHTYREDQIK